jgi:RsiW-degrading membrane proteinase PrsW (M82 family)
MARAALDDDITADTTELRPHDLPLAPAVTDGSPIASELRARRPGLAVFLIGVAVWSVASAVTAATKDHLLVPTVIVSGSFAIPLAVVVSLIHRRDVQVGTTLSPIVMLEGFLGAGTLGLLLAALLESVVLPFTSGTSIVVGLIEEACKGLVIVLVARQVRSRAPLDGMVLGAIVGAGFACFETAGYAFNSYVTNMNHARFLSLVETELDRALIAPVGHMIWSSILGGVLFAVAVGRPRYRLTAPVWGTFLGVAALHALWDQADGWAIIMTRGFTGAGWHLAWPDAVAWTTSPTHGQVNLFNILCDGLLLVVGLVGTLWFTRRWRRYRRAELAGRAALDGIEARLSGGPERDRRQQRGARANGTHDIDRPAERLDAIAEADEAGALAGISASNAVVTNADLDDRVGRVDLDVDGRRVGVLGGVRDRLGNEVVGGHLDSVG